MSKISDPVSTEQYAIYKYATYKQLVPRALDRSVSPELREPDKGFLWVIPREDGCIMIDDAYHRKDYPGDTLPNHFKSAIAILAACECGGSSNKECHCYDVGSRNPDSGLHSSLGGYYYAVKVNLAKRDYRRKHHEGKTY